jgi:hypothetical protein
MDGYRMLYGWRQRVCQDAARRNKFKAQRNEIKARRNKIKGLAQRKQRLAQRNQNAISSRSARFSMG